MTNNRYNRGGGGGLQRLRSAEVIMINKLNKQVSTAMMLTQYLQITQFTILVQSEDIYNSKAAKPV